MSFDLKLEKIKMKEHIKGLETHKYCDKTWIAAEDLYKVYCQAFVGCGLDIDRIITLKQLKHENTNLKNEKDFYFLKYVKGSFGDMKGKGLQLRKKYLLKKFIFIKEDFSKKTEAYHHKTKGFIYKIHNQYTSKIYIGSTEMSIAKRFGQHQTDYERYKKNNKTGHTMSVEIFKRGYPEVSLVEEFICNDGSELKDREKYWIRYYGKASVNKCNR